ncbi:hypothetical protein BU24DRAFT_405013 [Aaosphaeria arxii CBS 175.79]|uniref:Uncharacterized protein n=1 Tax=Aaosphaeria arxii CBS 175.79 TaxID=1450172 RepID=A0A6A5YBQ3_9PLEO|nr:uncharacterized protein BU24DRAFT_405013 [Aaosphaeria arxii CBS 175.79]KAF2022110.1 hypothetical protein BU24DRAFT_405013 [Aaosphaeria arxii CBS 175.79]
MPIPSLTSGLRPRTHYGRSKEAQSRTGSTKRVTPEQPSETNAESIDGPLKAPITHAEPSNAAKRRSFLPQLGLQRSPSKRVTETDIQEDGATERHKMTTRTSISHTSAIPAAAQGFIPQLGTQRSPSKRATDTDVQEDGEADRHKPTTRTSISQASTKPTVSQGVRSTRPRPQSMYGANPPPQAEQQTETRKTIPTRLSRNPERLSKPPIAQSGIGRSQSLRKPAPPSTTAAATTAASSTNARTHARTQSSIVLPRSRTDGTSSTRPKSLIMEPNYPSKPIVDSTADSGTRGVRASARIAAINRPTRTQVEPESTATSKAPSRTVHDPQPNVGVVPRRRENANEAPKTKARPAFSTLQQHFTPRKTGKAPTSFFLHPQPSDTNPQLPTEMSTLQAELLQLHLLHERSEATMRTWEMSAKGALQEQFLEVASLYRVMRESERQETEQKNLWALREWNSGNASLGLIEQMQILSDPLQEVGLLLEPGGRFERLAREFDQWMSNLDIAWLAQACATSSQAVAVKKPAGGLHDGWSMEHDALTRKLTHYVRDLDKLTQPDADSSIAGIVTTCRTLLGGILEELHLMKAIEARMDRLEKDWVEQQVEAIARHGQVEPYQDYPSEVWRT